MTTLDADSERALLARAHAGDREATSELVAVGMGWVRMHVARLGLRADDFDDGVQDGSFGLLAAIEHFDLARSTRLSTFAWPWIEGAIRRGQAKTHATSPPPEVEAGSSSAGGITTDDPVLRWRYGFEDGEPHSRSDVAERLGWSESRVRRHERQALSRLRGRLANIGGRAPDGANPL